jgi:hypothetical protein
MICLAGNLPALQVGNQQVAGYDAGWIEEALARAAIACNRQDFPFIDDIRDGILHYLENRCPLRVFALEDLFERMRLMLRKIGCHAIADHLTPLAPPVTVSLIGPAREAGNGYELVFFQLLGEEIDLLKLSGAESIRFCHLDECVKLLNSGKRSRSKRIASEQLGAEIKAFLNRFHQQSISAERKLSLTLDL